MRSFIISDEKRQFIRPAFAVLLRGRAVAAIHRRNKAANSGDR
jgi:hypothetical protein